MAFLAGSKVKIQQYAPVELDGNFWIVLKYITSLELLFLLCVAVWIFLFLCYYVLVVPLSPCFFSCFFERQTLVKVSLFVAYNACLSSRWNFVSEVTSASVATQCKFSICFRMYCVCTEVFKRNADRLDSLTCDFHCQYCCDSQVSSFLNEGFLCRFQKDTKN